MNLVFIVLSKDGMYLQLWPKDKDTTEDVPGKILYIPYGDNSNAASKCYSYWFVLYG